MGEASWRLEFVSSTFTLRYQQLTWAQAYRISQLLSRATGEGMVCMYHREGDETKCAVCGDEAVYINQFTDKRGKTMSSCERHKSTIERPW